MSNSNKICPKCGSENIYFSNKQKTNICEDCDAKFDRPGTKDEYQSEKRELMEMVSEEPPVDVRKIKAFLASSTMLENERSAVTTELAIEERKAECFAAQMLLAGVDRYFNDLSEMDFLSKVFCCMSAFQAPYKAVLVALYEYAVHSDNENLKGRIKEVFDLRFENWPEQFQSLGLDDSLVLPSNVINMAPLQEKIRFNEKNNPELSYHKDNENYLENIMKEISMIARENKWPR